MKRFVQVTGSKGNTRFQTEASEWQGLMKELKEFNIDASGLKAQIAESRLTLENTDSVLPEEDFTLVLSPVRLKQGAASYEQTFDADEIEDLSHTALRTEVKTIRKEAITNGDDDMLQIIDEPESYTRKTTEILQETLRDVYALITEREKTEEEPVSPGGETIPGVSERLFEIERVLGIRNDWNAAQWNTYLGNLTEEVRAGFPSDSLEEFGHELV